jgi:serine/threonine protein kinase
MLTILNVLGPQSSDDLSFLDEEGKSYMYKVNSLTQPSKLDEKFSKVDPKITKIVKKLLSFNPSDRASARACLKDPIFDDIRNKNIEKSPQFTISTSVDEGDFQDDEEGYIKLLKKEISKIKHSKLLQKLSEKGKE